MSLPYNNPYSLEAHRCMISAYCGCKRWNKTGDRKICVYFGFAYCIWKLCLAIAGNPVGVTFPSGNYLVPNTSPSA
jgi:hypothetical protein